MSNLRVGPAWLTPVAADNAVAAMDRAGEAQTAGRAVLRACHLTAAEIIAAERIAAMTNVPADVLVGEMVRAALAAIELGGWQR